MVAQREADEFEKLNPEFMIKDREEREPAVSRATWAAVGGGEGDDGEPPPPPRPPREMPTEADHQIVSAEVDDDD